jgi:nucleotide-binding universal stress UspA family protein
LRARDPRPVADHAKHSAPTAKNPRSSAGTFANQAIGRWHVACSCNGEGAHMIKITNVLVATDFSDTSESALTYAREFARTFGASLHVLHVVDNAMPFAGPEAAGVDFARLQDEIAAAARHRLSLLVTAEDRTQLRAVAALRTGSAPAFEIAAYAKAEHIDMIVIGTHGRGMIGHLLMGNVAEKVVRIAPCPVLTVHHPEHEFIQPDALVAAGAVNL